MPTLSSKNKVPLKRTMENKDSKGLKAALELEGFRRLWIGQIFSQLADKFYIVLMVYLIAQYWVNNDYQDNQALAGVASVIRMDFATRAQKITLLATGIYVANTLPAIFIGTFAGVAADRWPKKALMVASNGLRALLVLCTPICLIPGPNFLGLGWGYWGLILMTFLESILTQFFAPAEQSTIPLLVPKKHLLAANSVYQATSMGATIIGFALGDPLLRLSKQIFLSIGMNGGEFFLLPLCYSAAAISLHTINIKEDIQIKSKKGFLQEIIDGLRVLKNQSSVRGAMINLMILYSLLAALYVLAIGLASSIEGLGPTKFGTLLAMSGVGMVLGAILIAQIGFRFNRRKLPSMGLGLITVCLVCLGQSSGAMSLTLLFCGLLGIGAAFIAIPAQTTLQEDTPKEQRGKVFGLQNNLINISLSLPLVLAGALVSKFGLGLMLWLLAALAFIAALLECPWKHF